MAAIRCAGSRGDSCEAYFDIFALGTEFGVSGDTRQFLPDIELTACSIQRSTLNRDVVYRFEAPESGKWLFTLSPDENWNGILGVLAECGPAPTADDALACADSPGKGGIEYVTAEMQAGDVAYIVADGFDGHNAPEVHEGTFFIRGSVCGNGVREGGEQCDDGNSNLNDGCAPDCRTENVGEKCDDAVPIIPYNGTFTVEGTTVGRAQNYSMPGCSPVASSGADVLYSVVSPVDVTWTIRLIPDSSSYNMVLGTMRTCLDPAKYIVCSNLGAGGVTEEVTFDADAGETIYLIADGTSGTGKFRLAGTAVPR